jgi:tRNA pseudouridine32 synthase / 23S rRNA pseudouridine746 synthase
MHLPLVHPAVAGDFSSEVRMVHCDDALIVVEKPAGFPAVPGRTPELKDCVASRVQATWPDALVVHRLDMATSGLMVLARGRAVQRALSSAFERRKVEKRYIAIVAGLLPAPAGAWGEIDAPIGADWPDRPRRMIDLAKGKAALTRYRVLAHHRDIDCTRVELMPVTGRTHQLRVHLQMLGHPILGDSLYAPDAVQAAAPRLMLHASQIALPHPANGATVVFNSTPAF